MLRYPESAAKAEEKMWLVDVDAHCTAKNDDPSALHNT